MFKIFNPLLITPKTSEPITTQLILPIPPKKLASPIMTDAIAESSRPVPPRGSAAPNLAIITTLQSLPLFPIS